MAGSAFCATPCTLNSRLKLDLRGLDRGKRGDDRTDGEGKTNVAPSPRSKAKRRTVIRTMKRMPLLIISFC